MDKGRYSDHRPLRQGSESWLTDEFVFGITRGASLPARQTSARGEREIFEAGKAFEEIYPRYPFSKLVRLSTELGRWLARVAEKARHRSAQAAAGSRAGNKGYAQPLVQPAPSSQR